MRGTGLSFEDVERIVGRKANEVRGAYRNFRIAESARQQGVRTTELERRFGVFTRAMNNPALRAFIGAPANADVKVDSDAFDVARAGEVKELLRWLFGDETHQAVISESRQVDQLGKVVSSDDALRVLRDGGDFDEAFATSGGILERLLNRLQQALGSLGAAESDVSQHKREPRVRELVSKCSDSIERLRELIK